MTAKTIIPLFLLLLSPAITILADAEEVVADHAADPAKVSVVDFFHLLCDAKKIHPIFADRAMLLDTKRGAIIDLPNGYLHTYGDGAQPAYTLALFRRPDQSPVFVIVDHGPDPYFEDIKVYTLDPQGKPADISEKAWPLKRPIDSSDGSDSPITRYRLPRFGRTIVVVAQSQDFGPMHNHLASVAWGKDGFIVEPGN